MATYNGARFLREQLDSILGQTVPPDELVVVDDASTDDTYQILLADQESSGTVVKVFRNEMNIGLNRNFEKGALTASGDRIFFSDQDDVWRSDKIERMSEAMGGASLLYSNALIVDAQRNVICDNELSYHGVPAVVGTPLLYQLECNSISGHNLVVTRELLAAAVPFMAHMMYDQWLGIVACLQSGVAFLDEKLVEHRIHAENAHNNPALRRARKKQVSKVEHMRFKATNRRTQVERLLTLGVEDATMQACLSAYARHLSEYTSSFYNRRLSRMFKTVGKGYFPAMPTRELNRIVARMSRGDYYYRLFRC